MGSDAFRAPFDTAALLLEHCASAPSRRARAQQVADALWRDHALSFEECKTLLQIERSTALQTLVLSKCALTDELLALMVTENARACSYNSS